MAVWRAASELPPLDKNLGAKARVVYEERKRVYREYMEGRPARAVLDALGGAFLFLKELVEPFTIPRAPEGHFLLEDLSEIDSYAVYPD